MVVFLIGGLELWVLRIPEFVPEFVVFIICDCFFVVVVVVISRQQRNVIILPNSVIKIIVIYALYLLDENLT